MPIINNLELHWVKVDPARPERYKGKGPAKWAVQLRVRDKKVKESLEKDFGFEFTPMEVDDKIVYKTSVSRYAFGSTNGQEDESKPNKPVNVILADGTPVDPNTIGNGSIGNISVYVKDDKSSRTLKGIQITKLIEYQPNRDDEFELSDNFEIVRPGGKNELDDEIMF